MVDFTRHDSDRGLHARRVDLDIDEAQQIADMPCGAMAMQALETADRPVVVGLEVGGAAVRFAGVFLHPRAGDVVLAIAQRRFIKAEAWSSTSTVFSAGRGIQTASPSTGRCCARRVPCRLGRPLRHVQLEAIDEFVYRIAQFRRPLDHPTLERRGVLAVHAKWQSGQPRSGARRAGVAQSGGDDRIHEPVGGRPIAERLRSK